MLLSIMSDVDPRRHPWTKISGTVRCLQQQLSNALNSLNRYEMQMYVGAGLAECWKRKLDYLSDLYLCQSCQSKLRSDKADKPGLCEDCLARQRDFGPDEIIVKS